MGERDDSRRFAVGAGAPAGPDQVADREAPPADVVQAVAEFVDDLVEEAPVEGDPAADDVAVEHPVEEAAPGQAEG